VTLKDATYMLSQNVSNEHMPRNMTEEQMSYLHRVGNRTFVTVFTRVRHRTVT